MLPGPQGLEATSLSPAVQAAIDAQIAAAVVGLLDFKGSTDASSNPNYPSALKGDAYMVSVAGKIGGASGLVVEVGDIYFAIADNAGGTQAGVGASWDVLQYNISGITAAGLALITAANVAAQQAILFTAGAVPLTALASQADKTLVGNVSGGAASPIALTRTQSLGLLSGAAAGSDVAPTVGLLNSQHAYAQAATNTAGANLYLAGGIGRRIVTIVDYSLIDSGADTITLTLGSISTGIFVSTATVITAGTGWVPATSNAVTATALATYINTLSLSVTATAVGAVCYITPATPLVSFTLATSMTAGEGTVTSGTDGTISVPSAASAGQTLAIAGTIQTTSGIYINPTGVGMVSGGSVVFEAGNSTTTGFRVQGTYPIGWAATGPAGNAIQTALYQDTSQVIAQRNTSNAQTFRIYGTTTGPKYLSLSHDGTTAFLNNFGGLGQLAFGSAALATTDTAGYICIPSCAGPPTGVPASIPTGQIPVIYDTTGDIFWVYRAGWKKATGAGAIAITYV